MRCASHTTLPTAHVQEGSITWPNLLILFKHRDIPTRLQAIYGYCSAEYGALCYAPIFILCPTKHKSSPDRHPVKFIASYQVRVPFSHPRSHPYFRSSLTGIALWGLLVLRVDTLHSGDFHSLVIKCSFKHSYSLCFYLLLQRSFLFVVHTVYLKIVEIVVNWRLLFVSNFVFIWQVSASKLSTWHILTDIQHLQNIQINFKFLNV